MQVFKVYFKIIKANLIQIMIYIIIFLAISIAYSKTTPTSEKSFSSTKTNVALINLDENTPLIDGFKKYLLKSVNFIPIENTQDKLQDALFYRDVEYIITIPKNFSKDFLQGKPVTVRKTIVPDSTTRIYVDMAINKYFNAAKIYVNNVPGVDENTLVKEVAKGSASETQVEIKTFGNVTHNSGYAVGYFNFLTFSLFSVLILGVSSILIVFNNKNLKRRHLCSSMKNRTFDFQLIMANLGFALICYLILAGFGFIMDIKNMLSYNGLLLCINALVFTIAALSISYLVGLLIKNRSAQSSVANVISLGFSFLSGAFVPQELLSAKTLAIASFTPSYWYVKSNNAIGTLSSFSFNNLWPILTYMSIELGFGLAIFSVALVVGKQNRLSNS